VIPQADVLDGGVVPLQVLGPQSLLRGELLLLDAVQSVGHPGVLDVLLDVGSLGHHLIRHHPEPLQEGGVHSQAQDVGAHQDGQGDEHRAHAPAPDLPDADRRATQ